MKTVFACESQPIVIEGLKRILEGCVDLQLIETAGSPAEAAERIADLSPDVVLIDSGSGLRAVFDLISQIRTNSDRSQPVLWVTALTEAESFRALQVGARGILKKTLPVSSVLECLRAVAQGNIWIENSISNQVVGFLNRANLPRLTRREQQVVTLISQGLKNKQIAEHLSITTGTVKVHLMHIFEKTGVKDRFELALNARKFIGLDLRDTLNGPSAP